jgi:1,2-dihydroxy-3-keto-5-methylthiopentene dioxygenase
MKAYWFDNQPGDQREPHNSGRDVDPAYLSSLGILHYELPDDLASVDKIASDRNYKNRDEIEISPTTLPGYEEKVKNFFHEHLHEDEEIRYILDGGGYFDVRSKDDDWVRIRLERGDLMIMPAGIYHRFTTDEQNVCESLRFDAIVGVWLTMHAVHEGDEIVQGPAEVDAIAAWCRDGLESVSEGVPSDEGW